MYKKLLAVLLASLLFSTVTGCAAKDASDLSTAENISSVQENSTAEAEPSGETDQEELFGWQSNIVSYSYTVEAGKVTITRYNGSESKVSVPAQIDGMPVTCLGSGTFHHAADIVSVLLPETLTDIQSGAFDRCYGLEAITIPQSVLSVSPDTFFRCCSLESITAAPQNQYYSSENGVLYNKDKTILVCYPEGKKDTNFTVPSSVAELTTGAYEYYCEHLRTYTIPKTVTKFPDHNIFENAIQFKRVEDSHFTMIIERGSEADNYAQTYGIPRKYME